MSEWKMRASHFYKLLNEIQNCKCSYTGWELTPENTRIAHKVPLKNGGTHEFGNVELVHASIANLARDLSEKEIYKLCLAVVENLKEKYGG